MKDLAVIEITQEMYDTLCEDSWKLQCLKEAGVDSWDGYEAAIEAFNQYVGDDD